MPPEAVIDAWQALYGARWSISESVERDGRRLLIARPNAPLREDARWTSVVGGEDRQQETARTLSAAERRVVAALSQGHSNKLIAYELGIAISTVSTLLTRAKRKLGCKSRVELARAGRVQTRRSIYDRIAQEPA